MKEGLQSVTNVGIINGYGALQQRLAVAAVGKIDGWWLIGDELRRQWAVAVFVYYIFEGLRVLEAKLGIAFCLQ